jgi:hypothetical protein
MSQFQNAREFAQFAKGLGFKVYVAKDNYRGGYGFVTDDSESRVLSFSFSDGGSLGGNDGPPSHASGTGWRLAETPYDVQTADDVRKALYAWPDYDCGHGWKRFTTVEEYLAMYGASSGFVEI